MGRDGEPGVATTDPQCRIYCILARDGRSAVVFRRGPTKQVLVLRWWLGDDRIEAGQWFRGRIYERRCDLSPDGDLLIYFAAKWSGPHQTWTAVSRTPYLTALAFWPKGDAWGGGGVFDGPHEIGLNHFKVERAEAPSGRQAKWHPLGTERADDPVPTRYTVRPCAPWAGRGEDNPIEFHRLSRSGWTHVAQGQAGPYGSTPRYKWELTTPDIIERASPAASSGLKLQRILRAVGERDGAWYVEDYAVIDRSGHVLRLIPRCSWADWDGAGNLLFAMDGRLSRLDAGVCGLPVDEALRGASVVADLSDMRFEPRKAPDRARQWP